MSPSNVGNFGIGMVELVLGSLFLVAGGWVISADDDVSVVASSSSYLADGFYLSWSNAKLLQLIYPILQCRSFGVVCSASAPLTGHGSGGVVCGGYLIAGWIHRSLVRLRLGGPKNVEKSLVRT
ncbi:hypothetical protein T02_4933 [Trichinella nativa]|uniref:Uncharacterized protein n=1 Tax=Trichinella nativa TaxID=6335 RepID=A0A0V1KR68_9BILA|nr:hypothetical protein T02_4933 [Trichinella nativa]